MATHDYTLWLSFVVPREVVGVRNRLKSLVTRRDLAWPDLPRELDGLTIAHLSDLHIRRHRRWHDELIRLVASIQPHLVAITGDLMFRRTEHPAALAFIDRLTASVTPPLGFVGCYGNHDLPPLREAMARLEQPIMLANRAWEAPDLPLTVGAVDADARCEGGDLAAALPGSAPDRHRFRILLAHMPTWFDAAAEAGADLVLSGHTHGGQVRLPGRWALLTACDWPRSAAAGWFQRDRTTLILSRGLGESQVESLRFNCPRQLPLLTLRRGERPEPRPGPGIPIVERW